MAGVKSFLIDDLLVEKRTIRENIVSDNVLAERPDIKCSTKETGELLIRKDYKEESTDHSKYKLFSPDKDNIAKTLFSDKHHDSKSSSSTSIFPYSAIPLVYPSESISHSPMSYSHETRAKSPSYTTMLPYSLDVSRLNHRSIYARHPCPESVMLPTFSTFPHAPLPPSMDYMAYPSYFGHAGDVPVQRLMGENLHDKRHFINERIYYPMYQLGRSLYPTNCKRKGGQIRFNNSQTAQLEKAFVSQKYLNANDRKELAQSLGLSDRQVKTWFQNRRAKLRKCKGGNCPESDGTSGSPQDSRDITPPYGSSREDYDSLPDPKKYSY